MSKTDWQKRNSQRLEQGLAIIKRLPFTRAVRLTGSLAEGRGRPESDIDLFIEIVPGHLWLARALVTLAIAWRGLKRNEREIAGRFCLNWYATFDAPSRQAGRQSKLLWRQSATSQNKLKSFWEKMFSSYWFGWLEKLVKIYQIWRIERDYRTHLPHSMVRYSDRELGFHPPKRLDQQERPPRR